MPSYTDTHCHLNDPWFDRDLEEVLQRACQEQVERIMIPGYDRKACQRAISLCETYDNLFAAVGIHPNQAAEWNEQVQKDLESLALHPKVRAIGEIGLDYYRDRTSPQVQREVFRQQLELAERVNKPVIIHNRQADEDIYPILLEWQENLKKKGAALAEAPGVFHAFAGSPNLAQEAISHHYYLGIGGTATYPKAKALKETLRSLPLDWILLETDAPYLPPQPYRGKRNEPSYIPLIASEVAQLQNCTVEQIAFRTTRNANRLFGWERLS